MVFITNNSGIEFEVTEELANKFIQSGDIKWYRTIEWEYIEWVVEIKPEEPKKRKNIIRKPK